MDNKDTEIAALRAQFETQCALKLVARSERDAARAQRDELAAALREVCRLADTDHIRLEGGGTRRGLILVAARAALAKVEGQ